MQIHRNRVPNLPNPEVVLDELLKEQGKLNILLYKLFLMIGGAQLTDCSKFELNATSDSCFIHVHIEKTVPDHALCTITELPHFVSKRVSS